MLSTVRARGSAPVLSVKSTSVKSADLGTAVSAPWRILVTGAKGFIGSNLTKRLLEAGFDVYVLVGDDPNVPDSLAALGVTPKMVYRRSVTGPLGGVFNHSNPDLVVHLAARAIVSDAHVHPYETFKTNIMGTLNVLEQCSLEKVPCIIASSDKAYGQGKPPFKEGDPFYPRWPYDVSKACADLIANCYVRTYNQHVIVTRCANVYGPADLNWSRLVPHTVRAALAGQKPMNHRAMWKVKREWIYIDDVVDAHLFLIRKLLEKGPDSPIGPFNIGSGEVASPSEIVPKILEAAESKAEPVLVEKEFPELLDESVDSSRIHELGWHASWSLDGGLQETVRWYREHLKGKP